MRRFKRFLDKLRDFSLASAVAHSWSGDQHHQMRCMFLPCCSPDDSRSGRWCAGRHALNLKTNTNRQYSIAWSATTEQELKPPQVCTLTLLCEGQQLLLHPRHRIRATNATDQAPHGCFLCQVITKWTPAQNSAITRSSTLFEHHCSSLASLPAPYR